MRRGLTKGLRGTGAGLLGGGGGAWTPLALSPVLWLKADAITGLADGAAITTWNDSSGNGNHCTQATVVKKPIYVANGVLGKPEVSFSYKDLAVDKTRTLVIPATVSADSANFSYMFVGRAICKQWLSAYAVAMALQNAKLGYSPTKSCIVLSGIKEGTTAVYHQPHFIAAVSSATSIKTWYNATLDTFAATGSAVMTGGMVGADTGEGYRFSGNLYEVIVYDRALSDIDVGRIYTYVQSKYFGAAPTKQVVFDGDSLTTGYACINNVNMPGQVGGLLGNDWKYYAVPVAGQSVADMNADAAAEIDALYNAGLSKNVVVCWGGVIDALEGTAVADILTRIQTYCAARQAAGWQVVVVTCLPSNYIAEVDRTALNTEIRDHYIEWADAIADIAADSRIGDAGDNDDPVYYNNSDGNKTHLTQAGFAIVASVVKAAIDTL